MNHLDNYIQEKLLLELVLQHTITSRREDCKAEVQWGPVSHALNRTKRDCINKVTSLHNATLRRGPFSEEEDALILQRRAEWEKAGDGLRGLWKALEEEMGRPGDFIRNRWAGTLTKQTKATVFTPEMVRSFCIRSHQVELKGDI